jgi:hypothetical protein
MGYTSNRERTHYEGLSPRLPEKPQFLAEKGYREAVVG